jgi:hypothetical protein
MLTPRLAGAALLLLACGGPSARVELHLEASHARPAEIREVWSTRFRDARDRGLLAIQRAEAKLLPPGLVLDAEVRVPRCDAAVAEATRAALIDLATGRHSFALHRTLPEIAEAFAERLRSTLGVDVSTPADRPGQVVVAAPAARALSLAPAEARVVEDATVDGASVLWVLAPEPALDGRAVATARADADAENAAVELTFTDQGAAAMQALSEAARGQHVALLVDDRLALAPRVMLRLSHRLRLELPASLAADAPALARAIAASNLVDAPVLVRAEARCAAP